MEFEQNKNLDNVQPELEATVDPIDAIAKETIEEVAKTETPFDDFIKEEQRAQQAPKPQYASAFKPIVINGAVFKPLANPGPQPVVAPTAHVQLTPIIVPVAIVPFASQNQPVMQYEDKKPEPKIEEPKEEETAIVVDDETPVEPEYSDDYVEEINTDVAVPEYYAPVATATAETPEVVEHKPTPKKKGKYRGRNAIMAIMLLVFLVPTILGALVGLDILDGKTELFAGITLGELATEPDVVGEIISFYNNGGFENVIENVLGNYSLLIHLVLLVVTVICFIISVIGIFANSKLKTGTMGFIIFLLSFVLLLWVALLQDILIDGAEFDFSLVTSKLESLIGYARIWLAGIVTWIVGAIVRVKKSKKKSGKKAKA